MRVLSLGLGTLVLCGLFGVACGADRVSDDDDDGVGGHNSSGGSGSVGGNAGGAGGAGGSDCLSHAETVCAEVASCAKFARLYGSEASCLKSVQYLCEGEENMPPGFGLVEAQACSVERRAQRGSCDPNLDVFVSACAPRGSKAHGEPCFTAYQCASGACSGHALACGACIDAVAPGDFCIVSTDCAWGSHCRQSTCTPWPSAGDACTPEDGCVYYPERSYSCSNSICHLEDTVGNYGGLGDDCGSFACQGDLHCDTVCQRRGDVGANCDPAAIHDCLLGLYCDVPSQRCQPRWSANQRSDCP